MCSKGAVSRKIRPNPRNGQNKHRAAARVAEHRKESRCGSRKEPLPSLGCETRWIYQVRDIGQ